MSLPTKDSDLITHGANFDAKATANPGTFSLSAPQALLFHNAYLAFVAAYTAMMNAREAGTISKPLTSAKNAAREGLLKIGRELYAIVRNATNVSDADKEDIGVLVPKITPSVVPPPPQAPGVDVVATVGNTVTLRLYDVARPTKRAKPAGAEGAALFSFVGATAPDAEGAWKFEGNVSRPIAAVVFPPGTVPGAKVWFTAYWFNERKQRGPTCNAVGVNIPGGASMAA